MKKILLFITSVLLSLTGFAQYIPNQSFETWETSTWTPDHCMVPLHWVSSDQSASIFNPSYAGNSVTQTAGYSGQYGVLMQTAISAGDTVAGIIYSTDTITAGGYAFTARPANLEGYYKLTTAGGDSGGIGVIFTKWNNVSHNHDTIASSEVFFDFNESTYTHFSIPINYTINYEYPDTAFIIAGIEGPNGGTSHVGTMFYLDTIYFSGTAPLGINQITKEDNSVNVYPNPFSTNATMAIGGSTQLDNASLVIYNVLGQTVKTINNINTNTINIDRDNVPGGMYIYTLVNNGAIISTGKLVVQ